MDDADDPELIARNPFWRRHFVETMLTLFHYKPKEKSAKEKFELLLTSPFRSGMELSTI